MIPNTPFNPGEDREPSSPWFCAHSELREVARTYANGTIAAWVQCTRCGSGPRAVKASRPLSELPAWDESLRDAWSVRGKEILERRANAAAEARAERSEEWWLWYDDYRGSSRWSMLRRRVLDRSRGLCEAYMDGCTRTAVEVHHLTYDHVGDEPLFDLAAVCHECHGKITKRDRENRKAP